MSDEVLAKIALDVGYVRGAVDGIKETLATHQTVQTDLIQRIGALETAHTSALAKIATVKWFIGTGGAIAGFATRHFWPLMHK